MDYFDLHCDTAYRSLHAGECIRNGDLAVTLEKSRIFEKYCQVCALWIPDVCRNPQKQYERMLDNLKTQITLSDCTALPECFPAFFLSLEGGSVIKRISDVDRLASDGVKIVTLTWNGKNRIAGGVNSTAGLTDFGYDVIMRMNSLGMAVDLSHLNDRSFSEVIRLADRVLVTHTCCRAVYKHRRNLTDEQIKAVLKKNGIIGLCLFPDFLGEGDVFSDVAAHLNHLRNLGAENNVSIGSDFDGAPMNVLLDGIDKIPHLCEYLNANGFDGDFTRQLFFENAYAYFKELLN